MAELILKSPGISVTEVDKSTVVARPIEAGAAILGPTVKGPKDTPTLVTSMSEYEAIFGTTFQGMQTIGSQSISSSLEFLTSIAARSYFSQGGKSLLVARVQNGNWTCATAAAMQSASSTSSVMFETIGEGTIMNNSGSVNDKGYITSGTKDNVRIQISDVRNDKGTFTVTVRRGDDCTREPIILETFAECSLDPDRENYIARVIGDQKISGEVVTGNYTNKSNYIRVKSVADQWNSIKNGVFNSASYSGSLPKETADVLFGGASGSIVDSASLFYENMTTVATDKNQGVLAADYSASIELLNDTEAYKFNIISAPGVLASGTVDSIISLAENRGDCIAVVDTAAKGTEVTNVVTSAASKDSSYAATYWPWLQVVNATGKQVWVPASVVIPGVYANTDAQSAPWFAPAGMTRGGIRGVIQAAQKLSRTDRDTLYDKNVNPIASFPGAGLVIYGQKTLQQKASALDRVNVRRLLIELKENVKSMASKLLFEQNTPALRNEFLAELEPYLASVVSRRGLYDYKIDLSGNTDEAIDRNEFHVGIAIQPAKSIEFVYLTFTITSTGVDFD